MFGTTHGRGVGTVGRYWISRGTLDGLASKKKINPNQKNFFFSLKIFLNQMSLTATSTNNVKVYTVSGTSLARQLPDWLARRQRKALQKDTEWTQRIDLIQDFSFPEATLRIHTTQDGQHCMATGLYKPQLRVFDFANSSMKFDRHTNAENVQFELLSDDWSKSVHLQNDRTLEFHNEGQMHYRARIPKFGRDLAYHSPSCDVLVGGAGNEVHRLNIDQGRFMTPLETQSAEGVNKLEVNPAHQLFGFGTASGCVEFWDPRVRNRIGALDIDAEVTAMRFRRDGLGLAVGTSEGISLLYDLRQAEPWQRKDQQYGLPIKSLHWLEPTTQTAYSVDTEAKVLSADSRIIKLWSAHSGTPYTSIEPSNDINDVCCVPDTGLVFVGGECSEIQTYFIPQLGPAPRWCHFLENLTEEMEESQSKTIYDDYKFVSSKELDQLGLSHLVGTKVLKPYMHGFFMDLRLYERARAIVNPFAYEDYRIRKAEQQLEEARESRIRVATKLPKVNKKLAERLIKLQKNRPEEDMEAEDKRKKKMEQQADTAKMVLEDNRFKDIFSNPEFEVEAEEETWQQHTAARDMSDSSDEGE